MNIESIAQFPKTHTSSLPAAPPVIDEKMIKSILYLCIQGEVVIDQDKNQGNENSIIDENHTIDTFA